MNKISFSILFGVAGLLFCLPAVAADQLTLKFLGTGYPNYASWSSYGRQLASLLVDSDMIIDFSCWSNAPSNRGTCGVARLNQYGVDKNQINYILITHHHLDHFDPAEIVKFAQSRTSSQKLTVYGGITVTRQMSDYLVANDKQGLVNVVHLESFSPTQIGPYLVTALPANHDYPVNEPYVYIIKYGNKQFLYGTDSGTIIGDSLSHIYSQKFDLVIRERGLTSGADYSHMDKAKVAAERADWISHGVITEETTYALTHLAYCAKGVCPIPSGTVDLGDGAMISFGGNEAECASKSCSSIGYSCGTVSDGCGGTLNCGACGTGYTCSSGNCVFSGTNYAPVGKLDSANCWSFGGWACDRNDYSSALEIHFYADATFDNGGKFIGSGQANAVREQAVANLCGGYASHGFIIPTPETIKDGKSHVIYAYAINIPTPATNPLLLNSSNTSVTTGRTINCIGCADDCSISGAKQCSGSGYQTCGNYDSDACLEWGGWKGCGTNQSCFNGSCVDNCVPKTCAGLGNYQCGSWSDGCGATLNCGNCNSGYVCSGGICVASCVPKTCASLGYSCGTVSDGCGSTLSRGNCNSGKTCSAGSCVSTCVPKTCVGLGNYQCGSWSDGCGKTINCGSCLTNQTCSAGKCVSDCSSHASKKCSGTNLYWYNSCNAKEAMAQDCGTDQLTSNYRCSGTWIERETKKNGCSSSECTVTSEWNKISDCSTLGEVCANGACKVSCKPNTCASLGYSCGTAGDGCGGTLDCGACKAGKICTNGACVVSETVPNNQVCLPKEVSGCKICNMAGTDWINDNLKCASGEMCIDGACVLGCTDRIVKKCVGDGLYQYNSCNGEKYLAQNCVAEGKICQNGACVSLAGTVEPEDLAPATRAEILQKIAEIKQLLAQLIAQLIAELQRQLSPGQ